VSSRIFAAIFLPLLFCFERHFAAAAQGIRLDLGFFAATAPILIARTGLADGIREATFPPKDCT
jgi:hypothetical protein